MYEMFVEGVSDAVRVPDDIIKFFGEIKKIPLSVGIVSNGTVDLRLLKVAKSGISSYVGALVTREEVGRAKPNQAMWLYMMRKLGVDADEVVMIGDEPATDIFGAKRLGMKTVQITKFVQLEAENDDQKADLVIDDFGKVLKFVRGMCR